jgi:hypothetical protein
MVFISLELLATARSTSLELLGLHLDLWRFVIFVALGLLQGLEASDLREAMDLLPVLGRNMDSGKAEYISILPH